MRFQPVVTEDGSLSCLDSETGELCHNRAGAYREAVLNYVVPSLLREKLLQSGRITVLDACYGMGYNTWALFNECLIAYLDQPESERRQAVISVVGIELNPEVMKFLPSILEHPTFDNLKSKIDLLEHNIDYRTQGCDINTKGGVLEPEKIAINVVDGLTIELELWADDLRHRVPTLTGEFDAVFHDSFSPQKMPELWTADLFSQYFRLLKPRQGVLLTYSGAAAVRGGLQEAGFTLRKTEALGAKTGGTMGLIAYGSPAAQWFEAYTALTMPMDAWELDYLKSRAGIPYRDSGLSQSRAEILANREVEQAKSGRLSGSIALKAKPRRSENLSEPEKAQGDLK